MAHASASVPAPALGAERHRAGAVTVWALRTRADYERAVGVVHRLAVAPEGSLPRADQDLLDVLTDLVSAYEDRHALRVDTTSVTPIEMVRYFMEQRGMTGSDLGRALGNRQSGHDVLSGRRGLTKAHIRKLAEIFRCSPAVFL